MTERIPIGVLGISHRTAGVEIRDHIALSEKEQKVLIQTLKQRPNIQGSLVLSTCNRTEIYLSGEDLVSEIKEIRNWLAAFKKCEHFNNADISYELYGEDMARHFFKVISGLDSQIVGEVQITTQVKECYNLSHDLEGTDAVLNKLFNFAMQAKKKVFNNTFLYDGTVSISFAGVELARKIFTEFTNKNILMIGAGKTAELAAFHFKENGVKHINVVNRTLASAQRLARELNGEAYPMEDLVSALKSTDIVISATSSQDYIITTDILKTVCDQNNYQPIFLIDLAIPRDIEPECSSLDCVYLFNLDDLQEIVNLNLEKRKSEIPKSVRIIDEFILEFRKWHESQSMASVIRRLKSHLDRVRLNEIERLKKSLPQNGYAEEIDHLTENIINKVVRQHVKTLKKYSSNPELYNQHLDLINKLYELDDN
jgi:glutamyl-tRNA reductase